MQLLWINLIMDVLAAIALASESPHPTELGSLKGKEDIQVLPVMWRSITSQVIYQFIVMNVLLFAGPTMFDIKYNLIKAPLMTSAGKPTERMQHFTLMFQTFCLMQAFNMINSRVLGSKEDRELNIFRRLHLNWFFPVVVLSILNVQYAIVSYPFLRGVFGCTPLTFGMHCTAFCLGGGSLLVALLVKFTPFRWTNKLGLCTSSFEDQQKDFTIGSGLAKVIEPEDPASQSKIYARLLEN